MFQICRFTSANTVVKLGTRGGVGSRDSNPGFGIEKSVILGSRLGYTLADQRTQKNVVSLHMATENVPIT